MALAAKLPRREMSTQDLAGKRVLIREDLNVPIKAGRVTNDARLTAALPTLRQACDAGAAVVVMSHLGRPEEGVFDEAFSLAPVAARLGELLGCQVPLIANWQQNGVAVAAGEIVLLENVRFLEGEKQDADELARRLAALCDVFVMDAFATAHRAQASTHGVARFAPIACAGPLLVAELSSLEKALTDPARPLVAIVGGAKVSTKLEVLGALAESADRIIVGGGIANTFIAAAGHNVGNSQCVTRSGTSPRDSSPRRRDSVQSPTPEVVGRKPDCARVVRVTSHTEYLTFNLSARMAFENITPKVEEIVRRSGVQEGLVLCNAMHITASVFVNDDESGLHEDYKTWLEELAPFDASPQRYAHNRTGEDNADAHMKRQVMGREVVVAITDGRLDFGPWEQIFYGEFDGRRPKRVLVKVIGE